MAESRDQIVQARLGGLGRESQSQSTTSGRKQAGQEESKASNIQRIEHAPDEQTYSSRWRLRDDRGRQTWHYLTSDAAVEKWRQTVADKYFVGLETVSYLEKQPLDGNLRLS